MLLPARRFGRAWARPEGGDSASAGPGQRRVHPGPAAVDGDDPRRVEQHGGGVGAVARDGQRRAIDACRRLPLPEDVRRAAAVGSTPLSDEGCAAPTAWRLDKGLGWWDGDYRSTIYNHYLTPNSRLYDCWQASPPHNPAWKAARSDHPGGVVTLFCDGHVAFVKDTVGLSVWRALGTRSGGGEAISADQL